MKNMFITRGVSGAGKTTTASFLCDTVISADDYFYDTDGEYIFDVTKLGAAHDYCKRNVEFFMQRGVDVAVANTNTSEKEIKPYYDLAEKYGYVVYSLIVENRHGGKSVHNVPEETLQRQEERLKQSIKLR